MTVVVVTSSFTRTREQIRDMILRKLRKLGIDRTPSNEDSTIVYEAIDLRLKEMHKLAILWRNVTGTVSQNLTLTSGDSTVDAPDDLLFPLKIMIRDGTSDTECEIINALKYAEIPTKADTGIPTRAYLSGSTFYFWPVPNKDLTASLTYESIADDTAASTVPDIDVSFMRCLTIVCAYDLADPFHLPENRILRLKDEAKEAEMTMRRLNYQNLSNTTVETEYF